MYTAVVEYTVSTSSVSHHCAACVSNDYRACLTKYIFYNSYDFAQVPSSFLTSKNSYTVNISSGSVLQLSGVLCVRFSQEHPHLIVRKR